MTPVRFIVNLPVHLVHGAMEYLTQGDIRNDLLHIVNDLLGPGHGQAPVYEVILHVNHQQGSPWREDTLQPLNDLTLLLQLLD